MPDEEEPSSVFLVDQQPASLPSISSVLQELPEQQLQEDVLVRPTPQRPGYPTQQLEQSERIETTQFEKEVELIRPQRPRPSFSQREPEEAFAVNERPSSPSSSSSNSLEISRPFRPRPIIIQEPASDYFLKNFPEVAAPEGSDVPLDEQAAIREALFELKKETRPKA